MPQHRRSAASNFAWASMSATSSSKTATSSATASTLQPDSKRWPSPVGFASAPRRVRTYRVALGASSRAAVPAGAPLPLPDKPSLVVLPFLNMSGDPEQDYFVDGMVEEIITALSRIRWLFVIARNS